MVIEWPGGAMLGGPGLHSVDMRLKARRVVVALRRHKKVGVGPVALEVCPLPMLNWRGLRLVGGG